MSGYKKKSDEHLIYLIIDEHTVYFFLILKLETFE